MFSVLSAGFALQYLMWPVPFLALCAQRIPPARVLALLALAGLLSAFADLVGGGIYGLAAAGIRSTVGATPFLCLWLLLAWVLISLLGFHQQHGVRTQRAASTQ
jgi:hypothetical protein